MTDDELFELERLERVATAGPWEKPFEDGALSYGCRSSFSLLALDVDGMAIVANPEDAALIAAMRNALPSLLSAARERNELRRQVEAIREAADNCCECLRNHSDGPALIDAIYADRTEGGPLSHDKRRCYQCKRPTDDRLELTLHMCSHRCCDAHDGTSAALARIREAAGPLRQKVAVVDDAKARKLVGLDRVSIPVNVARALLRAIDDGSER